MGFFDLPGEKDKYEGECRKGDGFRVKDKDLKEALKKADQHSEEEHGSKFLGFRWK